MKFSVLRGKRFVEKVLDTDKKGDLLCCANPRISKKLGSGNAPLREALFCLSPPDLDFFHALYLLEPVETSPSWLIHIPDPFCHKPFFEKAKVRNLEISRPYSRLISKFRITGRPILILNSWSKAYQKMVTAMAL